MKYSPLLVAISLYCLHSSSFAQSPTCPQNYFELQLPANSKQCRIFGVKKPSTLSFYVNNAPETIFAHFKVQLTDSQTDEVRQNNNPILSLVSEQAGIRVYVYSDGAGTQVNIRAE